MSKKQVQMAEILERFEKLLKRARQTSLFEPTAMTLATVDPKGQPATRTVLLKNFDARGLVFFTNKESRKGNHITAHPWVSACFYWDPLQEQAMIDGRVEPVSDEESDAYWKTRPRVSQIGAWASKQSRPLKSRSHLLGRVARYTAQYPGAIPRPPHWGGFRIIPHRVEFWTNRPHRLHIRSVYSKTDTGWVMETLYP